MDPAKEEAEDFSFAELRLATAIDAQVQALAELNRAASASRIAS